MLEKIITLIAAWIMSIISTMGYGGIVLLMAIESACIPLPSEVIMPFAGFLVFKGEMSFGWLPWQERLAVYWALFQLIMLVCLAAGHLLEKYGKYVLISKKDLDWADQRLKNMAKSLFLLAACCLLYARLLLFLPV